MAPEKNREAVEVIEGSGIVEEINGDQEWTASNGYTKDVGGKSVVRLHVTWDNPVASSGPWVDVECQGTRQLKGSRQFGNVTKLTFYVDTNGEELSATWLVPLNRVRRVRLRRPSSMMRM